MILGGSRRHGKNLAEIAFAVSGCRRSQDKDRFDRPLTSALVEALILHHFSGRGATLTPPFQTAFCIVSGSWKTFVDVPGPVTI